MVITEKVRLAAIAYHTGRKQSADQIARRVAKNKGKKRTEAYKEKYVRQEKNPCWKGSDVKYSSLHTWVRKHKPAAECCVLCKKKGKLEISNISGNYFRDLEDYEYLCVSCHRKRDKNRQPSERVREIRPSMYARLLHEHKEMTK